MNCSLIFSIRRAIEFGTEIGGFQYNSPAYFVISSLVILLLYGAAYVLRGASLRIMVLIAQIALFCSNVRVSLSGHLRTSFLVFTACHRRIHSGDPLCRSSLLSGHVDRRRGIAGTSPAMTNEIGCAPTSFTVTPAKAGGSPEPFTPAAPRHGMPAFVGMTTVSCGHARCDRSLIVALRPLSGLSGFHGILVE